MEKELRDRCLVMDQNLPKCLHKIPMNQFNVYRYAIVGDSPPFEWGDLEEVVKFVEVLEATKHADDLFGAIEINDGKPWYSGNWGEYDLEAVVGVRSPYETHLTEPEF